MAGLDGVELTLASVALLFHFWRVFSDQAEHLLRLRDEGLHPVLNILGLKR